MAVYRKSRTRVESTASLAFQRGHQAGVAARRGRVDAGDALGGETGDVMWSAGFGAGPRQALAAKWLALDNRPDLVAVDVEIADPCVLLDKVADGIDPALQAQGEAI